eukprot:SM000001S04550  [mRNA]  locus=s1:886280:888693:- [translate_table: standard]
MPQSGEDGGQCLPDDSRGSEDAKSATKAAEQLARWRVGDLPTVYGAPSAKWRVVRNRRLQEWGRRWGPHLLISRQTVVHKSEQQPRRMPGGTVHEKGMIPQALLAWLAALAARLEEDFDQLVSPINHILINEYAPGQGIMRHQDGPLYYPVVLILSLGLPAVMQFHPHQGLLAEGAARGHSPPPVLPVRLPPRSLLIFKDAAYQDYLHEISEVINANAAVEKSDSEEAVSEAGVPLSAARAQARISLTCRRVEKVRAKVFRLSGQERGLCKKQDNTEGDEHENMIKVSREANGCRYLMQHEVYTAVKEAIWKKKLFKMGRWEYKATQRG